VKKPCAVREAVMLPVVVIPVFNHALKIGALVDAVRAQELPCLLVDDGSEPVCAKVLMQLAAENPATVNLVRLPCNRGKGAAVMAGFREAARRGYSHVVQIDADGQHDAADIAGFLREARNFPEAMIIGCPKFDASVPKGRLYGRYLTHVWVWINTLSVDIRDSMCGFRVYPLPPVLRLIDTVRVGRRMDFDIEILVRLHWTGVAVRNRDTCVNYPPDGISHFDLLRDNLRISRMHAMLFFGMLWRLPWLLTRKRKGS